MDAIEEVEMQEEHMNQLNERLNAIAAQLRRFERRNRQIENSMNRGIEPARSRSGSVLSSQADTASIADTVSSTSIESDEGGGGDTIAQEEVNLPQDEDPGPGVIPIKISGSPVIHEIEKRLLAFKSLYFRSYLARFHNRDNRDQDIGAELNAVELNADFVSHDAWEAIEVFIKENKYIGKNCAEAVEVLEGANYLQIEALQTLAVAEVKQYICQTNHVDFYNNFVASRGIKELGDFINSTIVRPSENIRRRKYGKFDLNIKLGHFSFKCHKAVVSGASDILKVNLAATKDNITDGVDIGATLDNAQAYYNLLEQIYIDREAISFKTVTEALSVLRILEDLKINPKFFHASYSFIRKMVTVENVLEIYQVGKKCGKEDLINIALYFIMFKIDKLKSVFLKLSKQEVCKMLSHSYLNICTELEVAKLAVEWIKCANQNVSEAAEVLRCVRWGLVSQLEAEHLIKSDHLAGEEQLREVTRELSKEITSKEPRGWPQLLLLVELLDKLKPVNERSHPKNFYIHSYDPRLKKWRILSEDQSIRTHESAWSTATGSMGVTKTEYDTLVFLKDLQSECQPSPFHISVYNPWTDTWSSPNQDDMDGPINGFEGAHNLVSLDGIAYMATAVDLLDLKKTRLYSKADGDKTVIKLWSVKDSAADNPIYSVTRLNCTRGPWRQPGRLAMLAGCSMPGREVVQSRGLQLFRRGDLVCAEDEGRVRSYHPATNTWHQAALPANTEAGGSWLSLQDGRVLHVGGFMANTSTASNKCEVYSNSLEDEPRSLGDLVKPRILPSLAEFKGFVFAAGGYVQSRKRKVGWDEEEGAARRVESSAVSVEASVEFYVPELDCWHLLPSQPAVSPGARLELVTADTPLRMLDTSFPPLRGVKRIHSSD